MPRKAQSLRGTPALTAMLLLAAGALLLAAVDSARATVGPPISVKLVGNPGPARGGEVYKGTLEIVADEPVTLAGFRLEGDGWQPMSLEAPAATDLAKSARVEVRFSAVPRDPDQPLIVAFEVGGRPVRHAFDLSERHHRRMKEGVPTLAVPAGAPRLAFPATRRDATAPPAVLPDDAQVRPAPTGAQTYNITVSGGWFYLHPNDTWIGTDEIQVRVWNRETFIPELLAATYTLENGHFSVTFPWDPADGYPSLNVSFRTISSRFEVCDHTYGDPYYWYTGTWYGYTGTSLAVGDLTSGDETLMPAMSILSTMQRNWRWHNGFGYDPGNEVVFWPADGQYHNSDGVHISDSWHEGGYAHEYGHHWQSVFAPVASFSYWNGVCDGDPPVLPGGHCGWCWEYSPVPTMEGFCYWLGDVVPHAIELEYGVPLNGVDNAESLFMCPDGTYHATNSTEGFYAALLRDIYDATPDAHNVYGAWHDALTEGADEIFSVVHHDNPTTPLNFLIALQARYPAMNKADLWETAKNCGYGIDITAPGVVTNLVSTSHTVNASSPDQTIAFSWTHAIDDIAGISGYGIMVANSRGLPSAIQDIGNVTTYTTSALATGTWYFSIRAVDRAGNWGSTYASCGPYIIRDPEPADLQWYASTGWARCLVPRPTNDATFTSVPLPSTLTGNSAATYFNYCGRNAGESATTGQLSNALRVDGVARLYIYYPSGVAAGATYYSVNSGPYNITGGRHTVEVSHDFYEEIMESNETNNRWAHQWVWSPYAMTIATQVTRNKPAAWSAGWDAVTDGSTLYYNCDGLSFLTARYVDMSYTWDAVCAYSTDSGEDYDCRLHAHSTGADNGFATSLGSSMRAAGYLDAVLINGSQAGAATWDVGVVNGQGGVGTYRAEWVRASSIGLDDSVTVAVDADKMMMLRRFDIAVADTGFYTCTVTIDPPTAKWQVNHYLPSFSTGTLNQYSGQAATSTSSGVGVLDMHLTQTGRHALAVYRDPRAGAAAVTVTIELEKTPPDFTPYTYAGWHAPFVPRPAADGTPTLVALPDTLYGNAASTYLNYCWTNDSPNPWPGASGVTMNATVHLDGVTGLGSVGWSSAAAHQITRYNQISAKTARGGRHTLGMLLDLSGLVAECSETNNVSGEQYCWSPYALTMGTAVNRSVPPERTGGWTEITSTEAKYYNCDGLRLPTAGEVWRAVGVMSGPDTDVDLRLHTPLTGAKNGFGSSLAVSGWGIAESDIVLVNGHPSIGAGPASGPYDLGVTLVSGVRSYGGEAVAATALTSSGADTYGPYTLAAQHVLDLYELWLTPGEWAVRLDNLSGTVNWGLSIYAPDRPYHSKSMAMDDGIAYVNGAGQDEWLTVDVPAQGWYALAVWKAGAMDLSLAGTYRLRVHSGVTEVPGESPRPATTALVGIHPNPFNPQTRIVYDLAAAGLVRLAVYDLRGVRVRTLVGATQAAGRHEIVWNGRDDGGKQAASGVYMLRLVAGEVSQLRKMTLVK